MKSSEFKIFIFVESYNEETAENYRNCNVAEKRIVSKLEKIISMPILLAQFEDLNEDCIKISRFYLLLFPRNKPSKSVTVGLPHRFKRFS